MIKLYDNLIFKVLIIPIGKSKHVVIFLLLTVPALFH